jgi:glycosyltransferase involved in cell wall biosynthesis
MTSEAEPLRIVHLIARLNVGGAALHVIELAAEQRRRGYEVVVAAGKLAAGEDSMDYRARELDVPVLRIPHLQRELSLVADARAIAAVRRLLLRTQPDVLHTHTAKAGGAGRLAAAAAGSKGPRAVVHSYHGHVLSGYFGPLRERVFRLVERALAYRTSALIAVSDAVRDDLVAFGVARPERFDVIPYGFDLPGRVRADVGARARRRAELGVDEETFVIGWAGRFAPVKRPLDLVRVTRLLAARGIDAVLAAIGDGPERPDAEALARELGVAGRCRFLGYRRDMSEWYAAFDAFLLTSRNEGAPVVLLEALAAGKPVVATRAGGTGSVVADGQSGYLVEIGDTSALADALEQMARDPGLREMLGRFGADDVTERYAVAAMVDRIEAVYLRVLAG